MNSKDIPRIVIAGTHSGCGKTTTALGIMAALTSRGLKVQPFKIGPDFIDPAHHTALCDRPSRNLDPFMMGDDEVIDCFTRASAGADIAVIEGMMGLYDGVDGTDVSSTANVAQLLDAPIILVADVKGMSRSVGALIKGYAEFDSSLSFAGVILTMGSGELHKSMIEGDLPLPLLGWLPRHEELEVEHRHLGLLMPDETNRMKEFGAYVEEHCDVDAIFDVARETLPLNASKDPEYKDPVITMGIGLDEAFCFYYRENFDYLRMAGVELRFFSPIHDELPEADCYYFGGGYPELHAAELANAPCRTALQNAAKRDVPIFGECGGLIWLSRELTTVDGKTYPMLGIVDADTRMENRIVALNYVIGKTAPNSMFVPGIKFRGHEFHYSKTMPDSDVRYAFDLERGTGVVKGKDGIISGSSIGGYTHIYFGKRLAEGLVSFQLKR